MTWPKSWIARIIFSHEGVDFRSLPGLTTAASRLRMNGIRLPGHILVVQYVGAPLSGDISDDVRGRYAYLRKYGPNDGLTLLADELVPHGITIIEPGVDHFYRDPEINLKSLAIANLVAKKLSFDGTARSSLGDVLLDEETDDNHGNHRESGGCATLSPVHGDRTHELRNSHRQRVCIQVSQLQCKEELVPGKLRR
jgi:hypothetical protein